MYYYILEQPKNGSIASIQKKIQSLLAFYGITGEICRVSPARSIEELTQIALAKQYNTIVAVGSDYLINSVAKHLQNTECALGIIPINASSYIQKLIGLGDIKDACIALKERKIKTINLAYILPDNFFLTKANIVHDKSTIGTIYFDKCQTNIRFTNIAIYSPSLVNHDEPKIYLNIENDKEKNNFLNKTFSWLVGKKQINNFNTYLRMRHLVIDTPEPMPVILDNKIIAKTPIEIKVRPKVLKIICARVKINTDKK